MYSVYKHVCPNGKVYIGITSTKVKYRWGKNGSNYSGNKLFYRAIMKYGWDNITHEILYSDLTKEDACEKEIELIALYKSNDPKFGYNLSSGGELSAKGVRLSYETRKKMSRSHEGKTFPDRSKPVTNITTGEMFHSICAAAKYYGLSYSKIKQACEKFGGKYSGFEWEYSDYNYYIDRLLK